MSHLHIPDGVLPWIVWVPAWAVTIVILVASGFRRPASPQEIAYRGALGALVLASMSLALPVGPVEYHVSLLGPVGVLLGAGASFEALFVVSTILALVGHGGITVVGLNALVLGAGAAVARPVYRLACRGLQPAVAFAIAAAVSQAVAGGGWSLIMLGVVSRRAQAAAHDSHTLPIVGVVVGVVFVVGMIVETLVAVGLGRFLARVKPELLPGHAARVASAAGAR